MILIIVESPAKCKKIESFLGAGYKCLASYGHIRILKNGLKSIGADFTPTYTISSSKQVKVLKMAAERATEVILASDDDREGEAIAWHIADTLNLPIDSTKRIIFHEITKSAVLRAMNHPLRIDMNKVRAQQARQILDLLVGYTISPVLWNNIPRKKGLSAGRCQTPALRLVYDNQIAIEKTTGQKVYSTIGSFQFSEFSLDFKLNYDFKEKSEMIHFLENSIDWEHKLQCSKPKTIIKPPPLPFTTSLLQQKASNECRFSPKKTMKLAQILYEKGYITYMRTDSKTYSKEFVEKVKKYITKRWPEFVPPESSSDSTNEAAHEAIRPTNIERIELGEESAEQKLYKLIWRNTLESCMSAAKYSSITAKLSSPKTGTYYIYKTEIVLFAGWKICGGVEGQQSQEIKKAILINAVGDSIPYTKICSKATLKKLISHYTEARLVQLLEKKGIGRPSTFSNLIDKIQERGYVTKGNIVGKSISCIDFCLTRRLNKTETMRTFGNEKQKLILQPLGRLVIEFLIENFNNLFIYEYTKQMEKKLDDICNGKKEWQELCRECKEQMKTDIKMPESIEVAEGYIYYHGQYGPCVKYEEDGKTKYKAARNDLDYNKLKKGEYTLSDILKPQDSILGKYKDFDIILKTGKYGNYVSWNKNNISIKSLGTNITLESVIPLLLQTNIIRKLNKYCSIRKGKWGPYIFFKNPRKKKPEFLKLYGFKLNIQTCPKSDIIAWIKMKYNIIL